ncbi:LysR substrate-binding domain-containing protein [Labrys miyagiensis]
MRRIKLEPKAIAHKPPSHAISLLGTRIPLVSLTQALAVADHLNFRRAADALGVSQSAVSTRVKLLEHHLGIVLFERRHRGVHLTQAGQSFLSEIAIAIDRLDHAVTTAGMAGHGHNGRLRICLHSALAAGFLAELLQQYHQRYPMVDVEILEDRTRDAMRRVREGDLDVAFVMGKHSIEDCHSRQLWTEPLVVALSSDHPLALHDEVGWSELAGDIFLVRDGGEGPQLHEHIIWRLCERGSNPRIARRDVGRDTLMHMVGAGEGIALASEAMTQVVFPGVIFRPLIDEPRPVVFSAIWSPHNRSRVLHEFLNLAQQRSRRNVRPMLEIADETSQTLDRSP